MAQVHHFEYGWVTPVFAYTISVLGSLLGLISTARARVAQSAKRRGWLLVLAAWAIGGTGIWVMHFIAMVGFAVPDAPIRYDVEVTVASFAIAVVVVGVGLFIVGYGRPSVVKLLLGGLMTGVSVAFMHYTGMAAMRLPGEVGYDRRLVLASYAIAIVAATVALWFTLVVRGGLATLAASAIMGGAVCGMHYTGMAAMQVHLHEQVGRPPGVNVNVFLAPIALFVVAVVVALAYVVMATPSAEEQDQAASLHTALTTPPAGRAPAGSAPAGSGRAWPGAQTGRAQAAGAQTGRAPVGGAQTGRAPAGSAWSGGGYPAVRGGFAAPRVPGRPPGQL